MAGRPAATSALGEALARVFVGDLLERTSSLLAEPPGSTSEGLCVAFAALFAATARGADDPSTAAALASLIEDSAGDPGRVRAELAELLLSRGADSPTASLATRLLAALFADDSARVASALAGASGVRLSSGDSLLRLAAPLALAALRELQRAEGLAPRAVLAWLAAERVGLAAAVPPALARALAGEALRSGAGPSPGPRVAPRAVRWLRSVAPERGAAREDEARDGEAEGTRRS